MFGKSIVLLSLVLSNIALAEAGQASSRNACGPGKSCTSAKFTATSPNVAGAYCVNDGVSYSASWRAYTTGQFGLAAFSGQGCAPASALNAGVPYLKVNVPSGSVELANNTWQWWGSDGTAALPAWSFRNDTNTGLYRVGADQLGVSTAGVRSFNFTATAGVMEGSSATAKLTLNDATGSQIAYGSTNVTAANGTAGITATTITMTQGAGGVRYSLSNAPTTFTAAAATMHIDSNTGRSYWSPASVASGTLTPVDLGGHPHPATQQRLYSLDPGIGNGIGAIAWAFDIAPRVPAGTVTVTTVDAAAALSSLYGNNDGYKWPARQSNTLAAIGSTSSFITSNAWIYARQAGPRWCQRVMGAGLNKRLWVGLADGLPGSSDAPAAWNHLGFRYSTAAGDANWQYCYAAGAGTTCVDTGVSPSNGTGIPLWGGDLLCVDGREGGAVTFWVNGVAKARITSGHPASGTLLHVFGSVEARAAAAVAATWGRATIEVN